MIPGIDEISDASALSFGHHSRKFEVQLQLCCFYTPTCTEIGGSYTTSTRKVGGGTIMA